jgi:hypothetical protein
MAQNPAFDRITVEPVNKRDLSTGETGELVRENVGCGLNPGVECATPRNLFSNWRNRRARKNLGNVANTDEPDGGCCCQQNRAFQLGVRKCGSPLFANSNQFSISFVNAD